MIRTIERSGYSTAVKDYESRRDDVQLYEGLVNARGYFLLKKRKYDRAIELFKFNVTAFPKSSNAHDSLAEAYLKTGNEEMAIQYYKQALELEPGLESASEALKKLGAVK